MSLTDSYNDNNIFAKILRGEMPCWKVYEDDFALAFLDIFPRGPGHTLVIPKIAATNFLTFPAEALGPYMTSVQKVAQGVQRAFASDGLTLLQFNGTAGGQTVFHLHVHLIPRFEGVPIAGHEQARQAEAAILKEHAHVISAQFA